MAQQAIPVLSKPHAQHVLEGVFFDDRNRSDLTTGILMPRGYSLRNVAHLFWESELNGAFLPIANKCLSQFSPEELSPIYDNLAIVIGKTRAEAEKCFKETTPKQKALALMLHVDKQFAEAAANAIAMKTLLQNREEPDCAVVNPGLDKQEAPLSARIDALDSKWKGAFYHALQEVFNRNHFNFQQRSKWEEYQDLRFCSEVFWKKDSTPMELDAAQKKIQVLYTQDPKIEKGIAEAMVLVADRPDRLEKPVYTNQQRALAIKIFMNHLFGFHEALALHSIIG